MINLTVSLSYFRSAARVGSGYARPDLSALNHLFEKYRGEGPYPQQASLLLYHTLT